MPLSKPIRAIAPGKHAPAVYFAFGENDFDRSPTSRICWFNLNWENSKQKSELKDYGF
jgi:hypothetical protein